MTLTVLVRNEILLRFGKNPVPVGDSIRVSNEDLGVLLTKHGLEIPKYPAHAVTRWNVWTPYFSAKLASNSLFLKCQKEFTVPGVPVGEPAPPSPVKEATPTPPPVPAEEFVVDPDYFYWPPETDFIEQAIRRRRNLILVGPTGCGKTELLERLHKKLALDFIKVNFEGEIHKEDLLGDWKLVATEKGTLMEFNDGPLPLALKRDIPMIWDEMDTCPPEVMLVAQAPLEKRTLYNPRKPEQIPVLGGFAVFGTANTDGKGDTSGLYSATRLMNEATMNRFPFILKMVYPVQDAEMKILRMRTGCDLALASRIVEFANSCRKAASEGELFAAISLRNTRELAQSVLDGVDIKMGFRATIFDRLTIADQPKIRDLAGRFWPEILK